MTCQCGMKLKKADLVDGACPVCGYAAKKQKRFYEQSIADLLEPGLREVFWDQYSIPRLWLS